MSADSRLRKAEILRGFRSFARVVTLQAYIQKTEIRCYYRVTYGIPPWSCRVGFAVKRSRTAVERNAIRRRMREAYRLRKMPLLDQCARLTATLELVFVYKIRDRNRRPPYQAIASSMAATLASLSDILDRQCSVS